MKHRSVRNALPVLLLLLLAACASNPPANTTTPATPSPQVTVLQADKTLADAANAAVKTAISLRNQGVISNADARTIENYCAVAAKLSDGIATIMQSSTDWPTQRAQVLLLLQNPALPLLPSALSTPAATAIQSVVTLVTQIVSQVTQP